MLPYHRINQSRELTSNPTFSFPPSQTQKIKTTGGAVTNENNTNVNSQYVSIPAQPRLPQCRNPSCDASPCSLIRYKSGAKQMFDRSRD